MKKPQRLLMITITLILSLVLSPISSVYADGPTYSTTITYQNIGFEIAHITILYYPQGQSTPISIPRPDLPVGASASVSIGDLDTSPTGLKGSAVIKSDVEVAVLTTHIPTTVSVQARPMAGSATKGSANLWLLYVRKFEGESQSISIQNLDNTAADVKLTFYGGGNPIIISKNNIPAGGAAFIDLNSLNDIGTTFFGSIYVEAVRSGSNISGKITGMALHSFGTSTEASATESLTGGGTKIYMPLAMCYSLGGGVFTSYYVFNTDPAQPAKVTVTYNTGKSETQTLDKQTGRFFHACNPSGTAFGYSGSAIITSNGPPILAVGTVQQLGMDGSFIGQTTGADRLALPYAYYSSSKYNNGQRSRTVISVMNMGGALKAGNVVAKYFGKDGTLIGTVPFPAIPTGVKIDTYAAQLGGVGAEFGYYADGSTGGSVIIEGPSGSSLMAVAWVTSIAGSGVYSGEVYNAIQPIGTP